MTGNASLRRTEQGNLEWAEPGAHQHRWIAAPLAAGVYLCRIETAVGPATGRFTIVR